MASSFPQRIFIVDCGDSSYPEGVFSLSCAHAQGVMLVSCVCLSSSVSIGNSIHIRKQIGISNQNCISTQVPISLVILVIGIQDLYISKYKYTKIVRSGRI